MLMLGVEAVARLANPAVLTSLGIASIVVAAKVRFCGGSSLK